MGSLGRGPGIPAYAEPGVGGELKAPGRLRLRWALRPYSRRQPGATFFGPLGLFYASAGGGALALILVAAVGVLPTVGFVLLFAWPASMVWAAIAASSKHSAVTQGASLGRP
jgi:hypothetical protein